MAKKSSTAVLAVFIGISLSISESSFSQANSEDMNSSRQAIDDDEAIEEIVVRGRTQEFYRIDTSSAATKTPTDFLSIPQSVQVLSRQLMEDQAATKITDLYRSISGVTEFSYAGITMRGFRQEDEIKYDGVTGDPFAAFSVPQIFNIERIEVLKGPGSMLYGVAQPGGLVNYVTKKPTANKEASISVFGGNYDHFGVSGEYSGPLNDSESVRARLGGYSQSKEPWRYNTSEANTMIDMGLGFDVGDRSSVVIQGIYMDQFMRGHRLRPIEVDENGQFLADRAFNIAEPTDIQALDSTVFQAIARHEFGDVVSTSATLRSIDSRFVNTYHEPRGLADTDNDGINDAVIREYRDQLREYNSISLTVDNIARVSFGQSDHTILFGGDYAVIDSDIDNRDTPNLPVEQALSLANPVYGQINLAALNAELEASAANGDSLRFSEDTVAGLFLQDQVKLNDHFEAVLGLRYDWFDTKTMRALNTVTGDFDDSNLTLRGGLIYRPAQNVAAYTSYSEGFSPQIAGNQEASNGPFDPLQSEAYEIGIKGDLFGGSVQASTAVYQITKRNLLQMDPDPLAPPNSFQQLGKVESRGIEFDLIGDITERWVLMFNYAYNDTRIAEGVAGTEDGVPGTHFSGGGLLNNRGDRFVNAPENTVGVWTRFEFPSISSSIAAGLDYVDDRINLDLLPVPSYTIYDVSWQTNWRNLNFQLNVKNLTDKEYATSGFARGNFPGEPRTIVLKVRADFYGDM